jgi:hypothetical protein
LIEEESRWICVPRLIPEQRLEWLCQTAASFTSSQTQIRALGIEQLLSSPSTSIEDYSAASNLYRARERRKAAVNAKEM